MSREAIVASFVAGSPGTLTKITFDELVEVARRWLDAVAERDYAKITFYSDVLKQNTPHSRVEDLVFERGPEKGIRMALEG